MKDVKTVVAEAQEAMSMAVEYLEDALAHIRAGKADVRLLDGIKVNSYGSMQPIQNCASVTTPDAREQWRGNSSRYSSIDRGASCAAYQAMQG